MVALVAGTTLLLCLFYFLSMGPAEWLWQQGYIPPGLKPAVVTVYTPLKWLSKKLPLFAEIIRLYVQLWTR